MRIDRAPDFRIDQILRDGLHIRNKSARGCCDVCITHVSSKVMPRFRTGLDVHKLCCATRAYSLTKSLLSSSRTPPPYCFSGQFQIRKSICRHTNWNLWLSVCNVCEEQIVSTMAFSHATKLDNGWALESTKRTRENHISSTKIFQQAPSSTSSLIPFSLARAEVCTRTSCHHKMATGILYSNVIFSIFGRITFP